MFERDYETAAPAVLDEDQSAVLRREIGGMLSALRYLAELCEPGKPVQRQLIHSILYTSESRLAQLSTITGVETDSAAERERRYLEIRRANIRVHELERQLGGAVTAEQTKQAVAYLISKLNRWWRHEGLGVVREAALDTWGGLTVTLSCSLFGTTRSTDSSTPVTDKSDRAAWLKSLEARGFLLAAGRGNIGHLAACEASRDALVRLVRKALPSAHFQNIKTTIGAKQVAVMSEARIYIHNLEDVEALRDAAEEEGQHGE
ncbi:hypothetical protein [Massilia orientalis]|uniref:Uncharacterized protein n=1 Tax=Massilia orientalis TaxID=3050128 RepID=A0ACC7MK87_9BURK|nr:hypothetical protein [Massilia sp. YIM B02787]